MNIVAPISFFIALCIFYYVMLRVAPFVQDCKFTHDGVDIVVLGAIRVFHIKRTKIKAARIIRLYSISTAFERGAGFSITMLNRLAKRGVIIETTGLFNWILSPADPDAAIAALGFNNHRKH